MCNDSGDVLSQLHAYNPPCFAVIDGAGKVEEFYTGWIDEQDDGTARRRRDERQLRFEGRVPAGNAPLPSLSTPTRRCLTLQRECLTHAAAVVA